VTKQDGTTYVAREVSGFDQTNKVGSLYIATSGGTAFYVYYGNSSLTEPAAGSTYGKNNVWPNRQAVLHFDGASITDSSANAKTGAFRGLTYSGSAASLASDATGKFLRMPGEVFGLSQLSGTTDLPFGKVTTYVKVAQSFVCPTDFTLLKDILIRRGASTGLVAGNANVQIQADSSGSPSGTSLYGRTFSGGETGQWLTLSTTSDKRTYFEGMLTPGQTYWIVYFLDTPSDVNFHSIKYDPAGSYGVLKSYDGATWNTVTGSLRFALGTCDEVKLSSAVTLTYNNFSVAWKMRHSGTGFECIVSNTRGEGSGYFDINNSLGNVQFESITNNVFQKAVSPAGIDINDGNWHYIRCVSNGSNFMFYVDGVQKYSTTANTDTANQIFNYIGTPMSSPFFYGNGYTGDLDEMRFEQATGIDSTYITNEYNCFSNNAAFWTTGPEEDVQTDLALKARVKQTRISSLDVKAAVKNVVVRTIRMKGAVKQSDVTKTVTMKARIRPTRVSTITMKARIKATPTPTLTMKAAVKNVVVRSTTIRGRIKQLNRTYTFTSKARVRLTRAPILTLKARIKRFGETRLFTSRARIKVLGVSRTLSCKARIIDEALGFATMRSNDQDFQKSMQSNDPYQLHSNDQAWPKTMNDNRIL
jgi:hypothetical protein